MMSARSTSLTIRGEAESVCVAYDAAGCRSRPRIGCRRRLRFVGEGQRTIAVSNFCPQAPEASDPGAHASSTGRLTVQSEPTHVDRLRLTAFQSALFCA